MDFIPQLILVPNITVIHKDIFSANVDLKAGAVVELSYDVRLQDKVE